MAKEPSNLFQDAERNIHNVDERNEKSNCKMSDKKFKRKEDKLKLHSKRYHESEKDHKCLSCEISFSRANTLKRHINEIHVGHKRDRKNKKDHKCESCEKSFNSSGYLKKHIHTIHEGNKDYKCDSSNFLP